MCDIKIEFDFDKCLKSNAQHKKGKLEDNEGIQFQNKNLIKSLPIE